MKVQEKLLARPVDSHVSVVRFLDGVPDLQLSFAGDKLDSLQKILFRQRATPLRDFTKGDYGINQSTLGLMEEFVGSLIFFVIYRL